MKFLFAFTLFSFFYSASWAQTNLRILDSETKKPLAGIQITVNNDHTYISDASGLIQISNLTKGSRLKLNSKFYEAMEISWDGIQVDFSLRRLATTIRETQIIGKKPSVKLEAGKTILDASQATFQQGTLKDLLQQIPGVILDNNNNVSIKGKSGLRILVDGKTSQLAMSDMKTFVNSLPAGSVKSIEVLTNPGAQYDAQGKSGIIHIKLKKDKREGFNTKISAGVGSVLNKYNSGIFTNYKNEKINLFGNYQFNYNDQWYSYSEERISSINNTTQYYNYLASWENIARTHNLKGGMDLFLGPNSTLSYTIDYNNTINTGNNHNDNPSEVLDENKALQTKFLAYNRGFHTISTVTNGLSYRKTYDSSQSEWSIDAAHTYFKEDNTNINENLAFDALGNPNSKQYYYFEPILENRVHNIMVKTDVNLPLKFAKFELGLKNEANFNRNAYYALLKDQATFPKYTDAKYQNSFEYNDNIFAGYITANKSIGYLNLDLGLRAENTIISSNNPEVDRQYLNLFPNLGASMPLDSYTNVSARYSRRIQRPSFNQLNNRIVYYNRYTANVGVPALQPELADVFSLQADRSYMNGNLNLSLGVEYNAETNDIEEFTYIDSSFTSFFTSGNIGTANIFNTYLNLYFKPSNFIDINLTPAYINTHYMTTYKTIFNESKGGAFMLSGQVNIHLPARIKWSMNGWMTTSMITAQGHSDLFGMLNASVSRGFLNDKLNIELSCSDLFNSNIWNGYQTTGNIRSHGRWKPETRIAWLNFSYSFGKKNSYKRKEIEKSERIKATGR